MPRWLRTRWPFLLLLLFTIGLGLLVHFHGTFLPPAVRDMLGDALWAMMIAWVVAAAVPGVRPRIRIVVALAICVAVELSQLQQAPALAALRDSALGHLLLGNDFDSRDLAAYAVGVASAGLFERAIRRG